jgi:3-oxoacyl-[acyl-carrier-protein] synthase II
MDRRVAITGCGVVTPAGCELEAFWSSLMRGECKLDKLRHFSFRDFESLTGGEVSLPHDDDLPPEVDTGAYRSRCLQLALAAVKRAVAQATRRFARAPASRSGRRWAKSARWAR